MISNIDILVLGGHSFNNRRVAHRLLSTVMEYSNCNNAIITEPGVAKNYCCIPDFCKDHNYTYCRVPYHLGSKHVRTVTKNLISDLAEKNNKAIVIFWNGESWSVNEYLKKIDKLQIPTFLYDYVNESVEVIYREEL